MNKDQIYSLLQKAITAGGAWLAANGTLGATSSQWQQIAGAVGVLAGIIWGHYYNSTTPTAPPSSGKVALLLACLTLPFLGGCASLQTNINNGLDKLTTDANVVGQDLTKGGQALIAAGGDAVTIGTDAVKVGGIIVTNTTPKSAAPAGT